MRILAMLPLIIWVVCWIMLRAYDAPKYKLTTAGKIESVIIWILFIMLFIGGVRGGI